MSSDSIQAWSSRSKLRRALCTPHCSANIVSGEYGGVRQLARDCCCLGGVPEVQPQRRCHVQESQTPAHLLLVCHCHPTELLGRRASHLRGRGGGGGLAGGGDGREAAAG